MNFKHLRFQLRRHELINFPNFGEDVERLLRYVDQHAKLTAIAYTLIETCKLNGVNPEAWLAWVLERIQDHRANRINELLPWAYQTMINDQKAEAA